MPGTGQAGLDPAVVTHPEVGEPGGDGAIRKVGAGGAHPGFQLPQSEPVEPGRRERGQARLPGREPFGQLDDPAVHARDTAGRLGPPPRQLEHHVAPPRLADQDRTVEAEEAHQRREVGDGRVEIVVPLRRVGAAVAPLIEGDHRVAAGVQVLGDAVPEAEV